MPLAIGDPADAKSPGGREKTTVPIYDGTDVYKTHGLDATPVFIVVDADGVVRHVIPRLGRRDGGNGHARIRALGQIAGLAFATAKLAHSDTSFVASNRPIQWLSTPSVALRLSVPPVQ